MNTLLQDLRYAVRAFARNPGFTMAALLSLAIGIGANAAIFSVVNGLLLRPLPYADADRLVILWNRSPGLNITQDWFSTAQYFDIRNGHHGFEQVAIAIGANDNLTGDGNPERVGTIRISSGLLPMLGVKPALGRIFISEEDSPGRPLTALLSHGMWVRRYGGDPHMIGKSLTINGKSYEVVGILPQSFSLPQEVLPTLGQAEQADVVLPLPMGGDASGVRTREDYNVIGKLKPGVSVQQAQAEMDTITARLRQAYPGFYPPNGGLTFGIVPLLEQVVGDVRRTLLILLGSVGCVLLIACANVANLMLSRAIARQKELAVRTALGASRGRVVRQLLTESTLLAVCGGALGVVLAFVSVHWVRVIGPQSVPRLQDVAIDGRVLLFTLLISIFSGVLLGLAPALRVGRLDLQSTLKDADRGSAGASSVWGRGNNTRRLLVISELALSVVLLIGAGLLVRSFARLQKVAPGFNPSGVLTFELTMTGHKYDTPQAVIDTYHQLWEHLDHLPGVSASGGVTSLPLGGIFAWGPITVDGRVPPPGENFINADQRVAGGDYFQAMEIPLRRGRFFNDQDTYTNPRVAIVDEYMAQELWPNQDPIGKRIHYGGAKEEAPWLTVIGVVGRIKQYGLDADSRIAFYYPQTQFRTRAIYVVVRSNADPSALTAAVTKEIHNLDPDLPLYRVRTMAQRLDESMARRRFSMVLLGLFAGLALVLATIGIYGVIAYLVSQGTREIGIRIALGASQRNIVGLVVRQGISLALAGVALGLGASFVLTRFMSSLLFGINATDAFTFTVIPFLLALVALTASYVPARRAAGIDPMIALRRE